MTVIELPTPLPVSDEKTDTLNALRGARELVAKSYTTHHAALDANGKPVQPMWGNARSYSIVGAIIASADGNDKLVAKLVCKLFGERILGEEMGLRDPLPLRNGNMQLYQWQETSTQEQALSLIDRAIAIEDPDPDVIADVVPIRGNDEQTSLF